MKNLTTFELGGGCCGCGQGRSSSGDCFIDGNGSIWRPEVEVDIGPPPWEERQKQTFIQPYTLGPRNELIPGEAIRGCFDSSGEWGQDLVVHPEYICLLISPTDADSDQDYLRCVRRGSGEVFEHRLTSRWYRLLSGLYGETVIAYTTCSPRGKSELYAFTGFNLQPVWSLTDMAINSIKRLGKEDIAILHDRNEVSVYQVQSGKQLAHYRLFSHPDLIWTAVERVSEDEWILGGHTESLRKYVLAKFVPSRNEIEILLNSHVADHFLYLKNDEAVDEYIADNPEVGPADLFKVADIQKLSDPNHYFCAFGGNISGDCPSLGMSSVGILHLPERTLEHQELDREESITDVNRMEQGQFLLEAATKLYLISID